MIRDVGPDGILFVSFNPWKDPENRIVEYYVNVGNIQIVLFGRI